MKFMEGEIEYHFDFYPDQTVITKIIPSIGYNESISVSNTVLAEYIAHIFYRAVVIK